MHYTLNTAKDKLDAHVCEILAWHFSQEAGCPFWLDWAKESFDLRPQQVRHWHESAAVTASSISTPFASGFQEAGFGRTRQGHSNYWAGQGSGNGRPPRDLEKHRGTNGDDHEGKERPRSNWWVALIEKLIEIVQALTALSKELHELGETILFRFGPQIILAITIYYIAVAKFKHPDDQSGYPKGAPISASQASSGPQLSDAARH